jgi:hypothetical protein
LSYDPQDLDLTYEWVCTNGQTGASNLLQFTAEESGDLSCDLTITSASGLSVSGSENTYVQDPNGVAEWTVLVFIAADNNLEEWGIEDINEMEIAGSSAQVNVLAQLDRSPGYTDIEDNWTGARRYYITQDNSDSIASPVVADLGLIDSGDHNEVVDFVEWGTTYYPAQKYALVIWNHGWSWSFTRRGTVNKGISDDESSGNSISIANGELTEMLEEVTALTNGKLEVLGMDACIMQSWEIAHESYPFANYYVASQDYEGADGWDYENSMLDLVADPTMNGAELGESFAYRFYQTGDTALSTIDLSLLPNFESSLDELSYSLMNGDSGQLFRQAARNSYSYDGSNNGIDHDIGNMMDYFISNSSNSDIVQHATSTKQALEEMVITNYVQGSASEATGLSIYSPPRRNWGIEESYINAPWAEDTVWDDMLLSFQ